VYQFGTLFIHAWELHIGRSSDFEIIESVGQELADSYEEINLLYTITGSMNSVSYPDRFFELVCNELLKTISYNWIGIHLDNMDKFSRLGNDLYVVGHLSQSISHTTKQLRILSRDLTTSSSIISDGEDTVCSNFGPGTIIVPIVSSNRVIGVLVAGNKQGSDSMASSVDIKLLSASASQLAIFLENASLYEDLNATFIGTLEALSSAIDAKDRYTCGHSKRVALLTADLARAAGLEKEQVDRFQICGIVHDIGKIGVPESVLLKDGKLTDEEFDKIRMHPEIGARILRDIPNLEDIIEGVLHHHERFDGNGYPHGIAGTKIPLVARMIAIADTFDAMSSNRTYRPAMAHEDVLIELKRVMGTQFDPELVALFLELDFSKWDELVDEQQANAPTNEGRKAA
jgi:HD-GYP domain-containing protein (c-di-GMP phosphodiesterase class II)